ncbi:MAG TPA: tetratricopeptide repeat protein [Tepidisphaeraceae bacterium]|nr:tetratricopeptide repeat protein [Tepidisphaeraceae bacterium]
MIDPSLQHALQEAVAHLRAGRLSEAERICRKILAREPEDATALHVVSLAAANDGRNDEAEKSIRRAIAAAPENPVYYFVLGNVLQSQNKIAAAIESFRRAAELDPNNFNPHFNLGNALYASGNLQGAIEAYRRVIAINPNVGEAYNNLAVALTDREEVQEAVVCCKKALELNPKHVEAHINLGKAYEKKGEFDSAIASYQRALELKGDSADALNNLGVALRDKKQFGRAIECFERAINLQPGFVMAHVNLGNALHETEKIDQAIATYRRALSLGKDNTAILRKLGRALKDTGELDEVLACYRRAMELQPDDVQLHDDFLVVLNYHWKSTAQTFLGEARKWNLRHAAPLARHIQDHANDQDPHRQLRIGYVSCDFLNHASALFLLPLLRHHDRGQFHITCFSDVAKGTELTERMRSHVDSWHNTHKLSDEELAALVRAEKIDILVDLKLHTGGNRMLLFARKPAPVQVTWLGYPGTSGMETIDYRLTDPYLDPPGQNDENYTERSVRLPHTFWCYDPLSQESVGPLPSASSGLVTFGCLNVFAKVNEGVLAAFGKILSAVSGSHLLLLAPEGASRRRILENLQGRGIAADRVQFVGIQSQPDYLRTYHRIDIALDPFPCGGHTTSLDSMWMGVPVVTLSGPTPMGRATVSQLSNLGLTELIGRDVEDYVRIARELAGDVPRMKELRETLRGRMEKSALMDAQGFARAMEGVYRSVWQEWCARHSR